MMHQIKAYKSDDGRVFEDRDEAARCDLANAVEPLKSHGYEEVDTDTLVYWIEQNRKAIESFFRQVEAPAECEASPND